MRTFICLIKTFFQKTFWGKGKKAGNPSLYWWKRKCCCINFNKKKKERNPYNLVFSKNTAMRGKLKTSKSKRIFSISLLRINMEFGFLSSRKVSRRKRNVVVFYDKYWSSWTLKMSKKVFCTVPWCMFFALITRLKNCFVENGNDVKTGGNSRWIL